MGHATVALNHGMSKANIWLTLLYFLAGFCCHVNVCAVWGTFRVHSAAVWLPHERAGLQSEIWSVDMLLRF